MFKSKHQTRILQCLLVGSCLGLAISSHAVASSKTRQHHNAKLDRVNFTIIGIKNKAALDNIESALKNLKQLHLDDNTDHRAIRSIYQEAPKAIDAALKPFGFFKPTIQSQQRRAGKRWFFTFTVKPGIRSRVGAVRVTLQGAGKTDKRFGHLLQNLPIKSHQFFELGRFNQTSAALFELAANRGYFSAKLTTKKITVNLIKHQVNVDLTFNTGPRSRFGQTTFNKTPLNIHFLRKFLAYKTHHFYNANRIQTTQNNFNDTTYFSQVMVNPRIETNQQQEITPVDIKLVMRKRREYLFGLGYGTDTGPRGTLGARYNWLNQWGQYANLNAQGSMVNYSVVAGYHFPWPDPTRDLVSLLAGFGHLDIAKGVSTNQKISLVYRHSYEKWIISHSVNLLNEQYDIDGLPKTDARMLYFNANATYFSTSNHINPKNGYRIIFDLSGTPKTLSSTQGFVQGKFNIKWVHMLLKNTQFMTRFTYANTLIPNINNLPLSLQLLAGGTQSVRGYGFQSIGPGHQMVTGSFELRQRLFSQLYLAGFYDYGNVTDTKILPDLKRSAGTGLLFRSPVGIIQAGVAWRIHSSRIGVYVDMGPEL